MAGTQFKKVDYRAERLIDEIETGEIGLPDIQRPFVWQPSKVRNLFDSMYQGFPVGYLLFWSNAGITNTRAIGNRGKQSPPRLLIVDGQQRLTSLYSVFRGVPVLNEDYQEIKMRIAFRPRDGRFAVADAAIDRDPEYLPDITPLWAPGNRRAIERKFVERLRGSRPLSEREADELAEALDRLFDLQHYPFVAMELAPSVNEEQVAEVFVRINSEGVTLNQDDFILTLMSVFWEDGRKALEAFSRDSRQPTTGTASAFNHFIEPEPGQLLRVAVGLGFRRGALRHAYSLLRGRDMKTGIFSAERRDEQFATLESAQTMVLDLTNWHEFLKCLMTAGFRSNRMVSSQTAILYTYALYLIGLRDYGVDRRVLRTVMARWFFMATITSRYSSSPETRIEQDFSRLPSEPEPEAFVEALDQMIDQRMTRDYWQIELPNDLATSGARTPVLFAYHAALVLLGARALFSPLKVAELLDPSVNSNRAALERHHLFPKAYLRSLGIIRNRDVNQIANMALLEWPDNAAVGARPPAEYFPELLEELPASERGPASFWHALPQTWEGLDYDTFLSERRRRIAAVVEEAFGRLRGLPEAPNALDVSALVAAGETANVEFKSTARRNQRTGQRDPEMEWAVVKTVAGFANTSGGHLVIGVDDDGTAIGLDGDLALFSQKPNHDGYELWLRGLLQTALNPLIAAAVDVTFPDFEQTSVCLVEVPQYSQPVYANRPKSDRTDTFFLRSGNATRQLTVQEAISYLAQRA